MLCMMYEVKWLSIMRVSGIEAKSKGGFKSEGRGGFSQLPKMSAEKTILGFKK